MKKHAPILILLFWSHLSVAQTLVQPKWRTLHTVEKVFTGSVIDGYTHFLPRSYENTKKAYPLLFFLHGGLGVGGPVEKVNDQPIPRMLIEEEFAEKEALILLQDSFIIVNPHMNAGNFDSRQFYRYPKAFEEILADVDKKFRVDNARVYVTGLSRGGHGTWGIASRLPKMFAAAVPICGGLHGIEDFRGLVDLPIWVAHNTGDNMVSYSSSEKAVGQLEKLGGSEFYIINKEDPSGTDFLKHRHIFSSIDKEGHNAWTELYKRPEVYTWLLSQRKE